MTTCLYYCYRLRACNGLEVCSLMMEGTAFIVCADEFKMAVKNWNNGAVDGWNSLTDSDWTYSMAPTPATCAKALRGQLVKNTQLETARDPNALGNEVGESDFTGYTPLLYQEAKQQIVGQLNTANDQNCNLNYDIQFKGKSVCSSLPAT